MASDPDRASRVPSFDTVGENLSAVGSRTPNYTSLIEFGWFNQRGNYDYVSNTCSSPSACSLYLQVCNYTLANGVIQENVMQKLNQCSIM